MAYFFCHNAKNDHPKKHVRRIRKFVFAHIIIRGTSLDFGRSTFVRFKTADFKPNIQNPNGLFFASIGSFI